MNDSQRRQTAHHEAGHFVLGWQLGFRSPDVTIEPDDEGLGVANGGFGLPKEPTRQEVEAIICRCFAGFAAQVWFAPESERTARDASRDDDAEAVRLGRLLGEKYDETALRQRAQDLVEEFAVAVEAVAARLMEHGTITAEEAEIAAEEALEHVRNGALVMGDAGRGPPRRSPLELLQAHRDALDLYRAWLKTQPPFLSRLWESRLPNRKENDGAVWEAVAWGMLDRHVDRIESAESKKGGGPDFLCHVGESRFYVEATVLAIDGKAAKTGLRDRVLEGGTVGSLTRDIVDTVDSKVGQAATRTDAPVVVLTGTLHQAAAIHCFRGFETQFLPESLFLADAPYRATSRTPVREGIAAVFLATPFPAGGGSDLVGILHPCASVPLSRDMLPDVPFLGLADGWREGRVKTLDL